MMFEEQHNDALHFICAYQQFFCRVNFWGYSTVNYFSPMTRYSSAGTRNCGLDAINEFKLLVREAHKRGIEVTTCCIIIYDIACLW